MIKPSIKNENQQVHAAKDPEFETLYTKSILLNKCIRAWMVAQDQPNQRSQSREPTNQEILKVWNEWERQISNFSASHIVYYFTFHG